MYVSNSYRKQILIYDFEGNFKRSLRYKEDFSYWYIQNFDKDNYICYDALSDVKKKNETHPLLLISKKDGNITKEIQIPYKKKISTSVNARIGDMTIFFGAQRFPITCYFGDYALSLSSSDTIYRYQRDHTMTPLIVRTPSIQFMAESKVFLYPWILTDRYYFMETIKKVFDSNTKKLNSTDLLFDRQKNALFEYQVYNNDYAEKKLVPLSSSNTTICPRALNAEIVSWQVLEAYQLVEDFEKGILKGKLKEAAAGLNPESNPIIMLIKY